VLYEMVNISGNSDHMIEVVSACGGTSLGCYDPESGVLSGLTGGDTYYLRTYTYGENVSSVYSICLRVPPPAPSNDDCAGAIPFPVVPNDQSCSVVVANTNGATPSGLPTCSGTADEDVWFSFVMPSGVPYVIYEMTDISGNSDRMIQVFDACAGESLACYDNETGIFDVLTAGETYYLRAFTYGVGNFSEFQICLKVPGEAPVNDNCIDAIAFPAITIGGGCSTVTVDTNGGTGSQSATCNGSEDDDVWYTFTVPVGVSYLLYNMTTISGNGDRMIQVLQTCDGSSVGCYDPESGVLGGLVGGQTYFLRTYTYGMGLYSNYTICLTSPPLPPANDNCDGAIAIGTVPADGTCIATTINTNGASPSLPATECNGYSDDDVWYSFTVPAGYSQLLYTNSDVSGNTDRMLEVMSACGGSSLGCYDNESGALTGLTGGTTYLLRAYTYGELVFSEFELCLRLPPPAPSNDDCDSAIAFSAIPADGTCSSVEVNTAGATPSSQDECSGYPDDDLWFTFVMPEGIPYLLYEVIDISGNWDKMIEVLSACDGTSLACFDPESGAFSGLTAGETYYLRTYTYGESMESHYSICLSAPPAAPSNDDCEDAIAFPAISLDGQCAEVTAVTHGASGSDLDGCEGEADDDVWFTFIVPTGANYLIYEVEAIDNFEYVVVEILSACDGESVVCNSFGGGALYGLTPGETYWMRFYTEELGVFGEFSICLKAAPAAPVNDDCSGAIAFSAIPVNGDCSTVIVNTAGAHPSDVEECSGYSDDDVWYSFVVPAGHTSVQYGIYGLSDVYDHMVELFDACDGESIHCFDPESGTFTGLTAGATYYLRTYTYGEGVFSNYEICLAVTPPAVTNDAPCDAIELDVTSDCTYTVASNSGATDSADENIPAPGCASYDGGDVWFKVTVPGSGTVSIDARPYIISDAGMAIYSAAACDGPMTLIECDDDDSDNGNMPFIEAADLVPGSILYIRVWEYGNDLVGTFGICVTSACAAPATITTEVSANTVIATWPSTGDGVSYEWEVRLDGEPGSGNDGLVQSGATGADVTTVTIASLEYMTTYQFYVRSICTDGGESEWSNPHTFNTELLAGCTDEEACNYNPDAVADDGSCTDEPVLMYADTDGDGFGDPDAAEEICGDITGYVTNNTDCDDTDASVWSVTPVVVTIALPNSTLCDDLTSPTILTGGSPANGVWSGLHVSNGAFNSTGLAAGNYQVTYTVSGDGACLSEGSATATIIVDDCSGIDDVNEFSISLYPTQVVDFINVKGLNLIDAEIYDLSGRHIKTVSLLGSTVIEASDLAAGLYIIRVKSQENTAVFKVERINR
jgi:hypothetical protein